MPTRTRPIEKFAKAVAQCSAEVNRHGDEIPRKNANISAKSAAYGKCIVADYNSVHKDMCVQEFMRLKDCYLVRPLSLPTVLPRLISW